MAQMILSTAGQAIGGPVGRFIGGFIGRSIDNAVIAGLAPPRQRGPRLETLALTSTADGAPMACVFGRARVAGQVIWAARFLERRHERSGGKGGPRTVEYAYSLSFAVALCEGPIDGVGRVWADGQPLDLSGLTMRVHRGGTEQTPDPLIEAVEGAGGAPAFRGTAYVVFEDLPLGPFGNRPPQLAFEVFRRPRGVEPRLEDRLEGVCLIPGAGEFTLATEPVLRREGLTRSRTENLNNGEGRPDLLVSLDQLEAQCPNLKRVSLVIGWFGDDLRAERCTIRPGVERALKPTTRPWSVAGLDRHEARVVTTVDGAPAYGGTPSDESVRQAVTALNARGWAVTLYPFVFMDIPPGGEGPAYPWRGRIVGREGAEAAGDIAAFFGAADGWGLRRMARHYAALAAETGADGLLIGSELRGLTTTRDAGDGYPAVVALRALAAECRAITGPDVALSYAADWSEYFGDQRDGEVRFHLDPLWADPNIDYVGIDWYPPLGDWRDGEHLDAAAGWGGADDPAYLAAHVAGGEGFDWFYASDADRAAQTRTAIRDTAHGEDWLFRPKDLKGWWSNAHHDRVGGVRASEPTDWVPGMKPVRLTEFGCPAVDRGGNAPNLFQDPKSAESALPPFSTGRRDDRMQRRALEAVLGHFAEPANNPASAVYGGPMLAAADAWCWDSRPYPAFPAMARTWADAGAWASGHWLNGRMGGEGRDLAAAVLRRGGLADDAFAIEAVGGGVEGYVIDRPMTTREALEPLLLALGAEAAERGGRVAVRGEPPVEAVLDSEALALPDEGWPISRTRSLRTVPSAVAVRFIDGAGGYQTGSAVVRGAGGGGLLDLDLPAVTGAGAATATALRAMDAAAAVEQLTVAVGPLDALRLECGDRVRLDGVDGVWRVEQAALDETPTVRLGPAPPVRRDEGGLDWRPADAPPVTGAPFLALLDLPPLPGPEDDPRPLAAVAADPWRPMRLHAGPSGEALGVRGEAATPATVGVLVGATGPGPLHRWHEAGRLVVRVEGRAPESASELAVLGGANAVAVRATGGDWEIIQFRRAVLIHEGTWRLEGLLRGQQGTDGAMRTGLPDGAVVVFLDRDLPRLDLGADERGLPLVVRAGPVGAAPGGPMFAEASFTWTGAHARPWSVAHLRVRRVTAGLEISWVERARTGGDSWDRKPAPGGPFRVRILRGASIIRSIEVEAGPVLYADADFAADFPEGAPPDVEVAVAQYAADYGWGEEVRRPIS